MNAARICSKKFASCPSITSPAPRPSCCGDTRREISESIGANAALIGFGTGAGIKTRMLLEQLQNPIAYIPVDISKQRLIDSAIELSHAMPALEILPVCADYLQELQLPKPLRKPDHVAVYFPGSTIGNLEPPVAQDFLQRVCRLCGRNGGLIIGVDLRKDRDVIEAAYNDSAGVTAAFNLNLLARANRELGADFDLSHWKHRAVYNKDEGRIEMHLLSDCEQTVHVGGREFQFGAGEKIITEFSYKHTLDGFTRLAASAGFREASRVWTDSEEDVRHLPFRGGGIGPRLSLPVVLSEAQRSRRISNYF